MNSPIDKNYLDSRLETIMTLFSSEMKEYHARNEAAHARTEAQLALIRVEMIGKIDIQREEVTGKLDTLREEVTGKIDTLREEVAGKIDILREEMTGKINLYREENNNKIDLLREETGGKIDLLREETGARIARSENRIIKWVIGVMLANLAVTLSAMSVFMHVAPDRAAATSQPIVINLPPITSQH